VTPDDEPIRIWGIVPAAGMSRRMGTAKQTLPVGTSTMVSAVARTMLAANLDGIVVVTRSELRDALKLPDDPRLIVCFNDDATSQMLDSIRIGLARLSVDHEAALGPLDGVLVIPGDMPAVPTEACRACSEVFRKSPDRIVIATHEGRPGHPIIFPLALRPDLDDLPGGLNELRRRHADRVREVPISDPGILRDVDTRQDYAGLEP